MKKLISEIAKFFKEEDGQGMVEYGLIIGLISIAAITALVLLGPKITSMFDKVTAELPTT